MTLALHLQQLREHEASLQPQQPTEQRPAYVLSDDQARAVDDTAGIERRLPCAA